MTAQGATVRGAPPHPTLASGVQQLLRRSLVWAGGWEGTNHKARKPTPARSLQHCLGEEWTGVWGLSQPLCWLRRPPPPHLPTCPGQGAGPQMQPPSPPAADRSCSSRGQLRFQMPHSHLWVMGARSIAGECGTMSAQQDCKKQQGEERDITT